MSDCLMATMQTTRSRTADQLQPLAVVMFLRTLHWIRLKTDPRLPDARE